MNSNYIFNKIFEFLLEIPSWISNRSTTAQYSTALCINLNYFELIDFLSNY